MKTNARVKAYTQDEILQNIKRLSDMQETRKKERTALSKEINKLSKQIEYWENMPLNQIKMEL